MVRDSGRKDQDTLIDNIALGFTSVLGVAGAAAGVFIPGAAIPAAAIQAGAYCPAIVAAVVKGSIDSEKFSKKIEGQIKSCAEATAKECLIELKKNDPTMYSLFRDAWEKEGIYDQNSTLDSIERNMKGALRSEAKWEGHEITPKDINDVVDTYVQSFFINARNYPELDQSILYGVVQKTGELEKRQGVLEKRVDNLSSGGEKKITAFYEYIYTEFTKTPKSDLYGKISLKDGYIEPIVEVDGFTQSVSKFLETWVESDSTITVISGEPGHGKTSLCWKAMYEFYKNGWLADKVDNVFCFSLNPAGTDALSNDSFYLYSLLSWGDERRNPEYILDQSDCKNALIFFDGFDELKEWYSGLVLSQFIEKVITKFQEKTGSHIVITSRNMVIDPDTDDYLLDGVQVHINRLQLVTKSQQLNWIESFIEKCRDTSPQKASELEKYLQRYKGISKDNELEKLLGIPIIFRMLVEERFLPEKSETIPQIYDELFHITWKRHSKNTRGDDELGTKKKLQILAMKIFLDNNDTTEKGSGSISPWLFSFYTAHEGKRRVGFLHRSFYQYFLAHEILSWYRDYPEEIDRELFVDNLSYLARRKLDKTTLLFISELNDIIEDKDSLYVSFNEAYSILKETDGILPLPQDDDLANKMKSEKQLARANILFWNIVSIGSICGEMISWDKINDEALRAYDLTGCLMSCERLYKEHRLSRVLMREGADLKFADLKGADLKEANLMKADLNRAKLIRADLSKADLREANLVNSYLMRADLSGANFKGADLSRADLSRANLKEAKLHEAQLKVAGFNRADLSKADLTWSDLSKACFNRADLRETDLRVANLKGADLSRADLRGTELSKADLRGADLSRADLRGADLRGADLRGADLMGADLRGANLRGADLKWADLSGVQFGIADLRESLLQELDFWKSDLRGADLRGAKLDHIYLQREHVYRRHGQSNISVILDGAKIDKLGANNLKSIGCDISKVIIEEPPLDGDFVKTIQSSRREEMLSNFKPIRLR